MNKKGVLRIFGIAITASLIYCLIIQIFVVGPIVDATIDTAVQSLGSEYICPQELASQISKVCFNADGEVVAQGTFNENIQLSLSPQSKSCTIASGIYDFEYVGCKLDGFKQLSVGGVLTVTGKGTVYVKGSSIASQITEGKNVLKIAPKGLKFIRKIGYFLRFT